MENNRVIRTRYAPSPTGLFHIGGARTALYNYLFAKKNNGDFIVRIEDTDLNRNIQDGIKSQLNNLKWLKIFPDESPINPGNFGPYIQSSKFKKYEKLAFELLAAKKAYRCFCTVKKLEKNRKEAIEKGTVPKYNRTCLALTEEEIAANLKENLPFSIRLKMEDNKDFVWDDLVRGQIKINSSALTDPVILKSNKIPTYNFAVVIDDHDMKITHVIRGEEHISNTPYQLAIGEALNFQDNISFGHLSIIVDEKGKKLSKRNINIKQFIEDYKNMGFAAEAVTNFLFLLGMTFGDNKEIFSLLESVQSFEIQKVHKSAAIFDFNKMKWISAQYFKKMSDTVFVSFVKSFLTVNLNEFAKHTKEILLLFKNQISHAKQINELIQETFFKPKSFQEMLAAAPFLKNKDIIKNINNFAAAIKGVVIWDLKTIEMLLADLKKQSNLPPKDFFMSVRIYTTSNTSGPDLSKIIFLYGKKKVLDNVKNFLKKVKELNQKGK